MLAVAFSGSVRQTVPEGPSAISGVDLDLIPATSADVRDAVLRVFGDGVAVENVGSPIYLSADLNGDQSNDLAVMVTARRSLGGELENWSVQDVSTVEFPDTTKVIFVPHARPRPPQVKTGERLLAVIHGHGALGWRSREARQAYLLVNAEAERMSRADFMELKQQGVSLPRMSANPSRALMIDSGKGSFAVYWTGAQYASVKVRAELVARR